MLFNEIVLIFLIEPCEAHFKLNYHETLKSEMKRLQETSKTFQ